MSHYLIEFRFFGKVKWEIKQLISEVSKNFHLFPKARPVPHVTLVGPFTTNNTSKLIYDFKTICEKQNIMKFTVEGFDTFDDTGVVYFDVSPDDKLSDFRWELSKTLQHYCHLTPYDLKRDFKFHSTLAMKLSSTKTQLIKDYILKKPTSKFQHILMRVTLIQNQRIFYEYDFLLKRLLNRHEAKSRQIIKQSFARLQNVLSRSISINYPPTIRTFQPPTHLEYFSTQKNNSAEIDIGAKSYTRMNESVPQIDLHQYITQEVGWLSRLFSKPRVFCVADLHLDHTNIIKYCNRPFRSVSEMNSTLIDNWNHTIQKNDIVLFLGDLAFGKGSKSTFYWLNQLNGHIIFIKGNHDDSMKIQFYDKLIVTYCGIQFFLTHDPKDVPSDWGGWAICGHHHNNKPVEFPLINRNTKRINVGVELIDYKPILLDNLIQQVKN